MTKKFKIIPDAQQNQQDKSKNDIQRRIYLYFFGAEFYYFRLMSNKMEVLFTSEPDEQGMFGGLKVGSTALITDHYPNDNDCCNAFIKRYKATEDGISSICYMGLVIECDRITIDKEVRDILEAVGNVNHPVITVEKSAQIECGRVDGYNWNIYDKYGKHTFGGAVRKIGKEFLYNISRLDMEITMSLMRSIVYNQPFETDCECVLNDDAVVDACDKFKLKLSDEVDTHSAQYRNLVEYDNVLDDFRIIRNIINDIRNTPQDKKCYVLTDKNVIKRMCSYIEPRADKKPLHIALITKTGPDTSEFIKCIRERCAGKGIECVFTCFCAYHEYQADIVTEYEKDSIIYIDVDFYKIAHMTFDYIIQNPPYSKSLHMDYFELGYQLQKKNKGKMIIIQPANFYIDIRRADKKTTDKVAELRKKLEKDKAVSSIIIENYNYDFETNMQVPHAITYVDFTKEHNVIDFCAYGEHKNITSICNESNPYGNLEIINKITQKMRMTFGKSMLKSHMITHQNINRHGKFKEGTCFMKIAKVIGASGGGFAGSYGGDLQKAPVFSSKGGFKSKFGVFTTGYIAPNCHPTDNVISQKIVFSNNINNGTPGSEKFYNIYGTRQELENWIENAKDNALILFLTIIYTWDQNNHTTGIMPWLTDKVYTDKEIFDKCKLTYDERIFIINIIMMFRRDGAYFRRYMLGTNQSLINALKNAWRRSEDPDIIAIRDTLHIISEDEVSSYLNECQKEAGEYVKRYC